MLVAGVGPMPPERPDRLAACGLRVWGIARELARAGHAVRLACALPDMDGKDLERPGGLRIYDINPVQGAAPVCDPVLPEARQVDLAMEQWPERLAREAAACGAAAAIGSNDWMCHALARAGLKIPIWMDFFGDPMAAGQMRDLARNGVEGLSADWQLVAAALARADRLSGCGADQCAAILGQLGAVGRLNRHTMREPLVFCLPPWVELIPIDIDSEAVVRGALAPRGAYLIVQTGGFHPWLDVKTLFAGLEQVLAADPHVHFAASGGPIPGQSSAGYEWFAEQTRLSPYRERYHLLGWLPLGRVPRLIHEGDLGLNVDLDCTEGRLGTRNRLIDWLVGGLPVISTPGCELAQDLGAKKLITLIPHERPDRVARAVLAARADPATRRRQADQAGDYLRADYSPRACMAPLLEWSAAPKPASDLHAWTSGNEEPPALFVQARDGQERESAQRRQAEKLARLEGRLARLEGSRLVRLAMRLSGQRAFATDERPNE